MDALFQFAIPFVIGILALIGVVSVITTRADAFGAADRKSRNVWVGMLVGSAIFLLLSWLGWAMLGIPLIAGLVTTGIYWLDARLQIRGILSNAQGGYQSRVGGSPHNFLAHIAEKVSPLMAK